MNKLTLSNFEDAVFVLGEKISSLGNPRIGFIGQRLSDFLMFEDFVNLCGIVSLDYGKDAEFIERFFPVISLEKEKQERALWYSDKIKDLFENSDLMDKLVNLFPEGSILIPYCSNAFLERFAERRKLRILGPSFAIRDKIDDKIFISSLRDELNLSNPSKVMDRLDERSFESVAKQMGTKFVVQRSRGSSGNGTDIVGNSADWKKFLGEHKGFLSEKFVITPFIDGPVISINCVVTKSQIILMPPAVQVVGNKETSRKATVFSGVDFDAFSDLPPGTGAKIKDAAFKIAGAMRKRGFIGACNFNFLSDGLVLTDINARFMGSGQLSTEMQIANQEIPLSLIHLMAYLDIDFMISEKMIKRIASPKKGSLIVIHGLENEKCFVGGDLKPGIYASSNYEFLRDGFRLKDMNMSSEEMLVGGAIPQKNKVILPDAPLLRICTGERVLDSSFFLNAKYATACRFLYSSLGMKPRVSFAKIAHWMPLGV